MTHFSYSHNHNIRVDYPQYFFYLVSRTFRKFRLNTFLSPLLSDHRRAVAYQMQDLVCTRCRLVKAENMAEFCTCSGAFRTRESADEFARSFRIFRNIAQIYRFPWLEETVRFTLQQ